MGVMVYAGAPPTTLTSLLIARFFVRAASSLSLERYRTLTPTPNTKHNEATSCNMNMVDCIILRMRSARTARRPQERRGIVVCIVVTFLLVTAAAGEHTASARPNVMHCPSSESAHDKSGCRASRCRQTETRRCRAAAPASCRWARSRWPECRSVFCPRLFAK